MRTRVVLGVAGSLLAGYGVVLLVSRQDPRQWWEVVLWLAAGVLAHDALLSAAVVGVCLLGSRLLPPAWRAPAAVALVVGGSLTVVAVPVLGGGGVRADNPTLLDRPYVTTWWVLSAIVVLVVAAAGLVRARTTRDEG